MESARCILPIRSLLVTRKLDTCLVLKTVVSILSVMDSRVRHMIAFQKQVLAQAPLLRQRLAVILGGLLCRQQKPKTKTRKLRCLAQTAGAAEWLGEVPLDSINHCVAGCLAMAPPKFPNSQGSILAVAKVMPCNQWQEPLARCVCVCVCFLSGLDSSPQLLVHDTWARQATKTSVASSRESSDLSEWLPVLIAKRTKLPSQCAGQNLLQPGLLKNQPY